MKPFARKLWRVWASFNKWPRRSINPSASSAGVAEGEVAAHADQQGTDRAFAGGLKDGIEPEAVDAVLDRLASRVGHARDYRDKVDAGSIEQHVIDVGV